MDDPVRVLVVAAPADANRLAEGLEREDGDLDVLTAAGVAEALERLEDGGDEAEREGAGVDCVVSDFALPEGDGLDLLASVREDRPDLPFVLATADGSESVAAEAVSAGVTEYVPLGEGADRTAHLATVVRDAVAEARVEGARRETEAWYGRLLEHSTDYLFVVGPSGSVSYVSPAIEGVLGYEPDEVVGTQAFDFVHPDDVDGALEALGETLDHPDDTRTVEFRARHADGDYRWLEVRGRNLLDDPVVEGVLVNVRDVTDRKRQEQQLERERDRLAELASILSHDLRNPLSVAMGNLDVALEDREDGELAAVWRALERMDELIEGVLTLTRLGEAVTETRPFRLSSLAESCWGNVATAGGGLTVESDRVVDGDRERLKQVFENLFRNALEHGDGGAAVRVGALEDGFYVEDDGQGIPADRRERVFEPGFSTAVGGTGLGLNTVERIVEAHGWTIEVAEGADGGARFEVTGVGSTT